MIRFKNEEKIASWLVDLENHVTLLKANIECEKRKCSIVESNTDGFIYKTNIAEHSKAIKDCTSMIDQYIK
jgi:hypothetical protein